VLGQIAGLHLFEGIQHDSEMGEIGLCEQFFHEFRIVLGEGRKFGLDCLVGTATYHAGLDIAHMVFDVVGAGTRGECNGLGLRLSRGFLDGLLVDSLNIHSMHTV